MVDREAPQTQQVKIMMNGTPLPHDIMDVLVEVEVDTSLSLPDMFIMRFHADDVALINNDHFELGHSVEIQYASQDRTHEFVVVIKGEITAIDVDFDMAGLAVLTVRGYDRSHRLNRGTKTRVFVQMTDSDIVKKICTEVGLSCKVDDTKQIRQHVFQDNITDLAFLQALAQRNDFEVVVNDHMLHFRKPQGKNTVPLTWGEDLRSFHTRLSVAGQVDEVIVKGWNPSEKKEIIGQANHSKSSPEIGMGGWGGEIAKSAFNAARYVEVRRPVETTEEANILAQSILDQINAGFIEAEGTAHGNAELVAGSKIRLNNLGGRYNGVYLLSSVTHVFSSEGYDTHFTIEGTRGSLITDLLLHAPPSQALASEVTSRWGGVVPALVTNINDPEHLARIKVKFPWLDDQLESDWARLVSVGAGQERGLYMLPEVGDEVLVVFEHGDFNQPCILGGLWNTKDKPPEDVVKNGRTEVRVMKSRMGHSIRMVDDSSNQIIEIKDANGGTTITLNAKDNSLMIDTKGDVTLQSGAKMKLKALNVEVDATASIGIKGQNVKVEGLAILELKGGVVKIN